jgi:hypothetical protein
MRELAQAPVAARASALKTDLRRPARQVSGRRLPATWIERGLIDQSSSLKIGETRVRGIADLLILPLGADEAGYLREVSDGTVESSYLYRLFPQLAALPGARDHFVGRAVGAAKVRARQLASHEFGDECENSAWWVRKTVHRTPGS